MYKLTAAHEIARHMIEVETLQASLRYICLHEYICIYISTHI